MTENDLIVRAVRRFGIYGANESLDNGDYEFLSETFANALDELEPLGLALWTIDDTPARYADAFIDYAAPSFLPTFGAYAGNPEADRALAARKLRILTREAFPISSTQPDYF